MRRSLVTILAIGAFAGSAAAQGIPSVRPGNLTEAGFSDARLAALQTATIARLTFSGEADSLRQFLDSAQRDNFIARVVAWFGNPEHDGNSPRDWLNERSDSIRQAVGTASRAASARRSLRGRDSTDDAIDAVFAAALAEAAMYDEVAHTIPPRPLSNRYGLFPVGVANGPEARCFWGRRDDQTLAGATLSGNADRGAVGVDLFTDYFGGQRINMGTAISTASSQDSTEENIQRFMAAGGSAFLGVAWPLLMLAKPTFECDPLIDGPAHRAEFNFQVILWPRLGFDLPALGSAATDVTGNIDFGVNTRLVLAGADRRISFYGDYRAAAVWGSNAFFNGIGHTRQKLFGYGVVTFGLNLGGDYGFSATVPLHGPSAVVNRMQSIYGLTLRR